MDKLDRRLIQLKIEREALKKESDEASSKRLDTSEEIRTLEQSMPIWKRSGRQKRRPCRAQHIKEELERARWNWRPRAVPAICARMSELQYGRIPELEKQLAGRQAAEGRTCTCCATR